ncbi:MAG: SMR family transporter [Proteobacteria bacterium]|nr:SMR family transporter [Pseudomonadota bacterium]
MNAVSFGLALAAIVLGAVGQVLLKAGTNVVGRFAFTLDNALPVGLQVLQEPRILGGAGCYALSLIFWVMALSRADLSVAYPMVSLGFALNALLAWWLLGETLGAQRIAGIAVIMVGVWLVARS